MARFEEIAHRDLVRTNSVVTGIDSRKERAGINLECRGKSYQRFRGGARNTALDSTDTGPTNFRKFPQIFEGDTQELPGLANAAANFDRRR